MGFIVKNTTFPNFLDLLAPLSCRGCNQLGSPLCDNCKNYIISRHQNLCPICKQPKTSAICPHCPKLPPTTVIDTRDQLIGRLIHDFKYHSVRSLARPLAEILDALLPTTDQTVIIVPLPTIPCHIRERGLDHTLLIAKHLAHLRDSNYQVQKLLLRAKNTVQVGSSKTSRLAQASTAYSLDSRFSIRLDATYLLLDDVWTTGASLESAYQKLLAAGITDIHFAILALSI